MIAGHSLSNHFVFFVLFVVKLYDKRSIIARSMNSDQTPAAMSRDATAERDCGGRPAGRVGRCGRQRGRCGVLEWIAGYKGRRRSRLWVRRLDAGRADRRVARAAVSGTIHGARHLGAREGRGVVRGAAPSMRDEV
jgi:hypothetical protein